MFAEFEVGPRQFRFTTRSQFLTWWQKERAAWEWLWSDENSRNYNRNVVDQIRYRVSAVQSAAETGDGDGVASQVAVLFGSEGATIPLSESDDGIRYKMALQLAGHEAATTLILAERNVGYRNNLNNTNCAFDFSRGVAASFAGRGGDREAMALERRNYRNAIADLEQRVRDLEAEKTTFIQRRNSHARRMARYLLRRSITIWKSASLEFERSRQLSIASITETEEKYKVQMALAAPVQYWKSKAKSHGRWEIGWAAGMVMYFIGAGFAVYGIALWSADYIINVPPGQNATPIYIIVSGATLGATTLIFWIGRIVSKLFLSEHHLRSDAREKAVMTEAFLSMETRESFSPEERAVILASIFRSTPDGLVKEEGPVDFGMPALLARAMSSPRP